MQYDDEAIPTSALRCAECGKVAESGAEGWRRVSTTTIGQSCSAPECAEREFGES